MQASNQLLKICKLHPDAVIPSRGHSLSAGLDLYSIQDYVLEPRIPTKIRTGIAMAIPERHYGRIADRSSMGARGITVFGGVVDSDYRGEVMILLMNMLTETQKVSTGDRVAQIIIEQIALLETQEVSEDELGKTQRGEGGFGSTGR